MNQNCFGYTDRHRDRKNRILKNNSKGLPGESFSVYWVFRMLSVTVCQMVTRQATNREHRCREGGCSDIPTITDISDTEGHINGPYWEAVGSLLYLVGATRSDILLPMDILSRHQVTLTTEDWNRAKCVFKYFNGAKNLGCVLSLKRPLWSRIWMLVFVDCKNSVSPCRFILQLYEIPLRGNQ